MDRSQITNGPPVARVAHRDETGRKVSGRGKLADEVQAMRLVRALTVLQNCEEVLRVCRIGTDPLKFSDARLLGPEVIFDRPKLRVSLPDLTPEPISAGRTPERPSARRGQTHQTSGFRCHRGACRTVGHNDVPRGLGRFYNSPDQD
jgi:hypothetical protein